MNILALARVHAHLCGDGMLCFYRSTEKDHRNRAQIAYFNSDLTLISEFRRDMHDLFNVKMTLTKYREKHYQLKVQSLRIAYFLRELSPDYHSRLWSIPDLITTASAKVKLEWIKAFSRDEGYLPKDRNCIRIKSVNCKGLLQVQSMLNTLQIKNNITGPNCDNTWYINIKREKELAHFTKNPSRE